MRYIQSTTSFSSGQLSRKLDGRTDIKEYASGCYALENFINLKEGGIKKLPESSVIYAQTPSSGECKSWTLRSPVTGQQFSFILYSHDTNIRYLINYGASAADDVLNSFSGKGYSAYDCDVAQYENWIIITHNSGESPPMILTYTDNLSSFHKSDLSGSFYNIISGYVDSPYLYNGGKFRYPFETVRSSDISVTISGVDTVDRNVSITLTGGADISDYVSVGEYIYVTGGSETASSDYVVTTNYYKVLSFSGTTAICDPYLTYNGNRSLPENSSPSNGNYDDWGFQSWGSRNGWPRRVVVHESRLIFVGTKAKPLTLYGSAIDNPFFFSNKRILSIGDLNVGVTYQGDIQNTDPFIYTIAGNQSASINFAASTSTLVLGTSEGITTVDTSDGGLLGPLNVSIKERYRTPTDPVKPAIINDTVFFSSSNGRQLHSFDYNPVNGQFSGKDVSILSSDIYDYRIINLAMSTEYNILMIILESGKLIYLSITKESGILSHAVSDTSTIHAPRSAAYLSDYEGFIYITQFINYGSPLTAIEGENSYHTVFQSLRDPAGISSVEFENCQLKVSRPPRDIVILGDIVAKGSEDTDGYVWKIHEYPVGTEIIAFLFDNFGILRETVKGLVTDADQLVTLPTPVNSSDQKFMYGTVYKSRMVTMPLELGNNFQSAQLAITRVDSVQVRVYKSYSFIMKEYHSDRVNDVNVFDTNANAAFTGKYSTQLGSHPGRDFLVEISNDKPEPFTLLSITLRGVSNDG